MSDLLRVLAVLALVGANAFFVVGEYAVVTARRAALTARAEGGEAGARAALRLMEDPVRVISTVQVGITAVGILTGALGEPLIRDLLGDWIPGWLRFTAAFAIVTYLSVVLGELVPKALTLDRSEALGALVAPAIEVISIALAPAVWVLEGSARLLLRPFGVTKVVAGETVRTPEELREVVDEAEESGVIPQAQEELLHNVFDFVGREARDIMVPAAEVIWLEAELEPDAALDRVIAAPHQRYPVGRGSLDQLAGVVHLQDLLVASRHGRRASLGDLARPALVIPETKDVGALLREQRQQRQHLAVVVDEYGGTAGIVTLEDVLEELVGEIEDEYDLPDSTLNWIDKRTVRAAGSMTIDDFNEAAGTELPQEGPRTLAGLAFHELGRRPEPGDAVRVDGVQLRVRSVAGMRITSVELVLPGNQTG
jgi:putative hemolysin